jgi:hypothetical protein
MNDSELAILRMFRTYRTDAHQMLFFRDGFGKSEDAQFLRAMESMVRHGFVTEERHRGAYSLTSRGYRELLKHS